MQLIDPVSMIWGINILLIIFSSLGFLSWSSLYYIRNIDRDEVDKMFITEDSKAGCYMTYTILLYRWYLLLFVGFLIYYGISENWYSPLKLILFTFPIGIIFGWIMKFIFKIPPIMMHPMICTISFILMFFCI